MSLAGLTRWPVWRRWFGSRAERAAVKFLRRAGYRILACNVRLPGGELDVIAVDGETIVFVEVRSTEAGDAGRPALSVDDAKQRKLTSLALLWLQSKGLLGRPARFDVLAVSWPATSRHPVIDHHPNAFEATGRFQMYT